MNARPALILDDPPPKTESDYAYFSDRELWLALAHEQARMEGSQDDDATFFEATGNADVIRRVMEGRGLLQVGMRRIE